MRINENVHDDHEAYSTELREWVEEAFQYACQITEMKRLLAEIRKEALNLRTLFLTEKELTEKSEIKSYFDARMQATVNYTLKNLERYHQYSWKELIYEGESNDG